jgi:glycosyltransferase involved in cell wall biosynthesis
MLLSTFKYIILCKYNYFMRIAVNTRLLLHNKLEGIGRFMHETLSRMVHNHPEHEFVFYFDRPHHPSFMYAPNVSPIELFPQARHPFLYMWWFEWSVARALKRDKIDVFLSPDGYNVLNTQVPTVMVVHDVAYFHLSDAMNKVGMWYHKKYMPLFCKKASGIATVSQYTKQDIVSLFELDESKIDVVYNAPSAGFAPLPKAEIDGIRKQYANGNPYFLYVGAMHPRKNIANLLKAYDLYRQQYVHGLPLIIVGRKAWDTNEIDEAYNAMKYKDAVCFTGRVSETDLHRITAAAHCMVYVPFFEGFGLPIIEAMACGVPVITANCTSMPEVSGEAALLVNPNDYTQIADAFGEITNNTLLYTKLKDKTLEQASLFNWDKSAIELWNCIIKASKAK